MTSRDKVLEKYPTAFSSYNRITRNYRIIVGFGEELLKHPGLIHNDLYKRLSNPKETEELAWKEAEEKVSKGLIVVDGVKNYIGIKYYSPY